jgi:hypothetical protein
VSRYGGGGAYGHAIVLMSAAHGEYRLYWTVDRYYPDSRLRFPRQCVRDTNRKGAEKFAKRWGCKMPEEPSEPGGGE